MVQESGKPMLQVRGAVDGEKFKAARTLGGSDVRFELRAMRPVRAGELTVSCLVCIVCIICIVCVAANAEKLGIKDLPQLKEGSR